MWGGERQHRPYRVVAFVGFGKIKNPGCH
jgi:hypothetical protein